MGTLMQVRGICLDLARRTAWRVIWQHANIHPHTTGTYVHLHTCARQFRLAWRGHCDSRKAQRPYHVPFRVCNRDSLGVGPVHVSRHWRQDGRLSNLRHVELACLHKRVRRSGWRWWRWVLIAGQAVAKWEIGGAVVLARGRAQRKVASWRQLMERFRP